MNKFHIITTNWQTHKDQLLAIRTKVFVKEQGVPIELEEDENDSDAWHFLVQTDDHKNIATARLLDNGHIGRMAVLSNFRGKKIGTQLLQFILQYAIHQNINHLFLNAQVTALPFYQKFGFKTEGEEFLDAGIVHCKMSQSLNPFKHHLLNQDSEKIVLTSQQDQRDATIHLATQAQKSIDILSEELEEHLYDQEDFVQACQTLVLRHQRCHIRLLIKNNEHLRRKNHRLLALMQRLPSRLTIKLIHPEFKQYPETFMIVDKIGLYLKRTPGRSNASICFKAPLIAKEYTQQFNTIWDQSDIDVTLRRLSL